MSVALSSGRGPAGRIRVLVVDDKPAIRDAICDLLADQDDMAVVGAVPDARQAIELARESTPDVALLDVKMPGGGAQAADGIRRVSPETKVVALSAYEALASILEMLRRGAVG